jgi:hypothetical protein
MTRRNDDDDDRVDMVSSSYHACNIAVFAIGAGAMRSEHSQNLL